MKARTPGRPAHTQQDKEKIRETIIAAAEEIFLEEGYEGLSMRKIGDKVSYSPAALYFQFSNKREILSHIWERIFTEVFEACDKAAKTETSPSEKVIAFCVSYVRYWVENPSHYTMIHLMEESNNIDYIGLHSSHAMKRFEIIRQWIKEAEIQENIDFIEHTPETIAKMLFAIVHGLTTQIIVYDKDNWEASKNITGDTLKIFLSGLSS